MSIATESEPLSALLRALRDRRALLVVDNCEHLLEAAAALISAILRACPDINVLASSRQALAVDGECAYRLPSLEVPDDAPQPLTASEALRSAAIELFVARAHAADDRFALDDANAPVVAEICRRLDGIPLAIELAAVRMRALTPSELNARLDKRFRILTRGKRDALPRQQTLLAMITWSFDLLDERERAVLRRLSIFTKGFLLEAASAVAGSDALDESDVIDILASLVDKSLVVAEPAGGLLRYRLLESTRAYARDKLDAAGERDAAAARHLRVLRERFSLTYERYARTALAGDLDAQFVAELDDVRAALRYARTADAAAGAQLLADVDHAWVIAGLDFEGLMLCDTFLTALPGDQHALRTRLNCIAAHLAANNARSNQAFALAVEAVKEARADGSPELLASALRRFVTAAVKQDRSAEAASAQAEAERLAPVSRVQQLRLLESRAYLARHRGDLTQAANALRELRDEWARVGHDHGEHIALIDLAEVEHARGRTAAAIELIQPGIARLRQGRNRVTLAQALCNMAGYCGAIGDVRASSAAAVEAIREITMIDAESPLVAVAFEHLALARVLDGRLTVAATLAGYTERRLREHMLERQTTERATRDRLMCALNERLTFDKLESLLQAGSQLPVDAALAVALR